MKTKILVIVTILVSIAAFGQAEQVTLTFQEGVNDYNETRDTELSEGAPDLPHGDNDMIKIDWTSGADNHGLLMFNDIFGPGQNQVPSGLLSADDILDATLTLYVNEGGGVDVSLHRMLGEWYESDDTWGIWGNGTEPHNNQGGIQHDSYESSGIADYTIPGGTVPDGQTGLVTCDSNDILDTVRAWWSGEATNHGWALLPGTNSQSGVGFASSEYGTQSYRPLLTVEYVPETGDAFAVWFGWSGPSTSLRTSFEKETEKIKKQF